MKCNLVIGDFTLAVDDTRVAGKHVLTASETEVGGGKKTAEKTVDSEMDACRIVAAFLILEDDEFGIQEEDNNYFADAFPQFAP